MLREPSSAAPGAEKISARRIKKRKIYPPAFKRKVLNYSVKHGANATAEKFKLNRSLVWNWRNVAGITRRQSTPKIEPDIRWAKKTHLLARNLSAAVRERLKTGFELDEVEIYATLLVKEILK